MRINEATSVQPVIAGIAGIFAESSGRLGATVAAMIGLLGAVIGGSALARSRGSRRPASAAGTTGVRGRATVAMLLGVSGIVFGALCAAGADGGVGTGNGLGGAIVAMALGLIGMILGGLARAGRREVA